MMDRCWSDTGRTDEESAIDYVRGGGRVDAIHKTLVLGVGDAAFEQDLFDAIGTVVDRHRPRLEVSPRTEREARRLAAELRMEAIVTGFSPPTGETVVPGAEAYEIPVEEFDPNSF
jgi:hypothetical protein